MAAERDGPKGRGRSRKGKGKGKRNESRGGYRGGGGGAGNGDRTEIDLSQMPCWWHLFYHHFRDREGTHPCKLGKECKRDHSKILSKEDFLKLPVPPQMRGVMQKLKRDRSHTPAPKAKAKGKAKTKPERPTTPAREPSTGKKPKLPKICIKYCWKLFLKGKSEDHEKGECKRGEHLAPDEVWRRWEEKTGKKASENA